MCDICVMNAVKDKMLSRRQFFSASVAVGAAAAIGTVTASPALADGHSSVEDLTHGYDETFPTYFGEPGVSFEQVFNFAEHSFNLKKLTVNEHTGTHIDAPLHFSADGNAVDEIPVNTLVAPLCIIDIAAKAEGDADAQVTPDDLKAWIAANGDIPDNACVAM
ncbi:MAG: cyclase family protein, partial [Pseudomonadota bacterium]